MSKKYIGKKLNPNTNKNIISSESESDSETLDLKDFQKKKYNTKLSKKVMGISSKKKEIKSIINQKEESIDIKGDISRPINNRIILEEINQLKYKNAIFEKNFSEVQKENINLKKYIEQLKNETQKNCNILLNKIDFLENQVKELQEFHFSAKLRKLLKTLIRFIIEQFFPTYMKYQEESENIFFFKPPRFPYNLDFGKDKEIINALNGSLKLLFSTDKEKDSVIHFVEQKGNKIMLFLKDSPKFLISLMTFSGF